ncbi:nucleotidyltransferase domain-containing protein [Clostridium sp.]|uniref:nucleotidyltransferase domain-containing protein n=1 Tax=Clostridium sp. TaxID=1506 RepID=UPI003F2C47C7
MDNTQKQFLELLSNSIRGKHDIREYENVNWNEILTLAKAHKVEGIIFSALKKSGLWKNINSEEFDFLKRLTFSTGIRQIKSIGCLSNIFTKLKEEEIELIALKGLVVRNFYPQPEQRSMCDADILIHKEDLERCKNILLDMGYILDDHEASHHIKLFHRTEPVIEVHWHIIKRDGFSGDLDKFEEDIWKRVTPVKVGFSEVLSLDYEHLALHLCMHMGAHLASTGFGLRQLCDLVLLVEEKGDDINWNRFLEESKVYGFEKFNLAMFALCKRLFNMDLPKEINVDDIINTNYMDALITEIFEAGVHGKKDIVNSLGNQLAFNFEDKDNNATLGAVKRFAGFIFPPADKMSDKYSYAKKYKALTPIAWGHHLANGVLNSDYKLKDKVKVVSTGVGVSVKKNKLLQWLDL